jgi:hypothetical protein
MVRKSFYPEHYFANKTADEISYHRGMLIRDSRISTNNRIADVDLPPKSTASTIFANL